MTSGGPALRRTLQRAEAGHRCLEGRAACSRAPQPANCCHQSTNVVSRTPHTVRGDREPRQGVAQQRANAAANSTVPPPTEPPRAQPMTSTVSSIEARAANRGVPRAARPVIRPSRRRSGLRRRPRREPLRFATGGTAQALTRPRGAKRTARPVTVAAGEVPAQSSRSRPEQLRNNKTSNLAGGGVHGAERPPIAVPGFPWPAAALSRWGWSEGAARCWWSRCWRSVRCLRRSRRALSGGAG